MSYQIKISDRSRKAAKFIRLVHREIQRAFALASNNGMTQQALASKLEIDRSTVNKRLQGLDNLTLRSIADLAWAMDGDIEFKIQIRPVEVGRNDHANLPRNVIVDSVSPAQPRTSSSRAIPTYTVPLSSQSEAVAEHA